MYSDVLTNLGFVVANPYPSSFHSLVLIDWYIIRAMTGSIRLHLFWL